MIIMIIITIIIIIFKVLHTWWRSLFVMYTLSSAGDIEISYRNEPWLELEIARVRFAFSRFVRSYFRNFSCLKCRMVKTFPEGSILRMRL